MPTLTEREQKDLVEFVGQFYADPIGYFMAAWPWEEEGGPLEAFSGPETWVLELLDEIAWKIKNNSFDGRTPVDPVQVAVASGNGAAKSAFAGMFTNYILSTRPMSRVTVTANTFSQLRTKTWPEVQKWTNLSITAPWFEVGAEYVRAREAPYHWFAVAHTWNITNPQSSAGQHSREGSSVFIKDEASHIPEVIQEQMDGGLTDGEPFDILLGNCTNRGSRLFRAVFGDLKNSYIHRSIDTRSCKYTNKKLIEKWIEERGIDSDWVKAHILGQAPNADDLQFIDNATVQAARKRDVKDPSAPLVLGLDFARGGSADNRLVWRQGRDAKVIPSRRIPGDKTRDTTLMVTLIANEVEAKKPDAVCGDSGNMGGPIMDQLRRRFPKIPVIDVMFGSGSPDERCGNMRAYIWNECRLWLAGGAIEDSADLEIDLTGPNSYENAGGKLFIESKDDMAERGLASPDWADALCTTFAYRGMPKRPPSPMQKKVIRSNPNPTYRGWMRR